MKIYSVMPKDRFLLSSTSKGNQPKWVVRNKFLKADAFGYESIAEVVSSEVEYVTVGLDYVPYSLCTIKEGDFMEKMGCVSNIFTKNDESLISLDRILTRYAGGVDKKDLLLKSLSGKNLVIEVINICSQMTAIPFDDIALYLSNMIKLDAIILNEDRHTNNISFIQDNKGNFKLSPIFDNGLSLLSDTYSYPFRGNLGYLMNEVMAKPFSSSFYEQLRYFSDYPLLSINRTKLFKRLDKYGVLLEGYHFKRAIEVLNNRLDLLNGVAWTDVYF